MQVSGIWWGDDERTRASRLGSYRLLHYNVSNPLLYVRM